MFRAAVVLSAITLGFVPSASVAEAVEPPMSYAVTRSSGYSSTVMIKGELVSPYLVVPEGGRLTFMNLHLWGHAIFSDAWKPGRERVERLFSSEVIPYGKTSLVRDVELLEPGTYEFFCANHMGMRGSLMIVSVNGG